MFKLIRMFKILMRLIDGSWVPFPAEILGWMCHASSHFGVTGRRNKIAITKLGLRKVGSPINSFTSLIITSN